MLSRNMLEVKSSLFLEAVTVNLLVSTHRAANLIFQRPVDLWNRTRNSGLKKQFKACRPPNNHSACA